MNLLRRASKDVIPRVGERYHGAISQCLQLVLNLNTESSDASTFFQTQAIATSTILEPLRISTTSGFRRSRGITTLRTGDLKDLHAQIAKYRVPHRASRPATINLLTNPNFDALTCLNIREGQNKYPLNTMGQVPIIRRRCQTPLQSHHHLARHKGMEDGYCQSCQVCLPSAAIAIHDKTYQPKANPRSTAL